MREMEGQSPTAVALKWDGTTTPTLVAKGDGELAREIIALAEALDIPLQESPELAAALSQLELGDEIPEMLYRAVAEIIAFAYYLSERGSVMEPTTA